MSENIRTQLVTIAGIPDDAKRYSWKKVRGIFYSLIDNDKSLEKKSTLAYFNGYFWTTAADTGVFALMFIGVSLFFAYSGVGRAIWAAGFFFLLAVASRQASRILTDRHMEIGNQQLEIIEQNHKAVLRDKLNGL